MSRLSAYIAIEWHVSYAQLDEDKCRSLCYGPPYEANYKKIMNDARLDLEVKMGRQLNFRR